MTNRHDETHLGRRIATTRLQRHLSQGTVSRRAGIDPSYLSRIETDKVHPTVRTAMRIAEALKVPLGDLLDASLAERRGHPCPLTPSGRCLIDLIDPSCESGRSPAAGTFSPHQVRVLRRCVAMIGQCSPNLLRAVEALLGECAGIRSA